MCSAVSSSPGHQLPRTPQLRRYVRGSRKRSYRYYCYTPPQYHTPSSLRHSNGSTLQAVIPHPLLHPKHTHPVGVRTNYHTPWFITPLLGPLRGALYHPGHMRDHNTPQDATPGDHILNLKIVINVVFGSLIFSLRAWALAQ